MARTVELQRIAELRKTAHTRMTTLVDTAEAQHRGLTSTEQSEFDQLGADMNELAARAERVHAVDKQEADTAELLTRVLGPGGAGGAATSWLPNRREYAELVGEQRSTGVAAAGAILPPTLYSAWFDRLRPRSAVLSASPLIVTVEGHSMILPTLTGSVTIGTFADNSVITDSDPGFGAATLTPVKFGAIVLASSEALEDSNGLVGRMVVDDLLRSTATAIDVELLTGSGATNHIRGLKNITGATVVSTPTNGSVPTLDTVLDLLTALESAGADINDVAVFLTPAVWSVLRKIKATTGGTYLVQPDPTAPARPSLFGARIFPTANLPQTETQGTAAGVTSTIIACDMSRVAVGVSREVQVVQSDDFAFDRDQVAIRVTARFDMAVVNGSAVALAVGNKVA